MRLSMSKNETPRFISLKVGEELYELTLAEAERSGLHLIDVVVQAMAEHFKRPDLAWVPRAQRGPKPGKRLGINGKHRRNGKVPA